MPIKPSTQVDELALIDQGQQTAVETVAQDIAHVVTVAGLSDSGKVDDLLALQTQMTALALQTTAISTLAAIENQLVALDAVIPEMLTLISNISAVGVVSLNMNSLLALHLRINDLVRMVSSLDNIDAVAENEANINSVQEAIPEITNLVGHIDDVVAVLLNITAVNTVASLETEVAYLGSHTDEIEAIYDYILNGGGEIPVTSAFQAVVNNLDVVLTDQSTPANQVSTWSWDFGDNSALVTTQNAAHTYAAAGDYVVELTVTNAQGTPNISTETVSVAEAPITLVPNFIYSANYLIVDFTDTSTDSANTIVGWDWDFNGEDTSTDQNPQHTFAEEGTFNVTLVVTDNLGGQRTVIHAVTVEAFVPSFGFVRSGNTVTFTNPNAGSGTWDFGDGNTFTGSGNPVHVYVVHGDYEVSYTDGTVWETTVNLPGELMPNLVTTNVAQDPLSTTVDYTATGADTIQWDIDGTIYNTANATHAFGAAGDYTVTVTGTNDDGSVTSETWTETVLEVNVAPTASWTVVKTLLQCDFDSTVTDPNTGATHTYLWDFGDGNTSTVADPTHTYAAPGDYDVTLVVTDDRGASVSGGGLDQTITVTNTEALGANLVPNGDFLTTDDTGYSTSSGAISYTILGDGIMTVDSTAGGSIRVEIDMANLLETGKTYKMTLEGRNTGTASEGTIKTLVGIVATTGETRIGITETVLTEKSIYINCTDVPNALLRFYLAGAGAQFETHRIAIQEVL